MWQFKETHEGDTNFTGIIVYDYELKIGWGKAVSLPSQALPAPPPGHMAIRSKEVCDASCAILWDTFLL